MRDVTFGCDVLPVACDHPQIGTGFSDEDLKVVWDSGFLD
jgi:hypothetical protein